MKKIFCFALCVFIIMINLPCIAIRTELYTKPGRNVPVLLPDGSKLSDEKNKNQNWVFAIRQGHFKNLYELNDGTIIANDKFQIMQLNLTPDQRLALVNMAVAGYVVITPTNNIIGIPIETIIAADPELSSLFEQAVIRGLSKEPKTAEDGYDEVFDKYEFNFFN